MTTATATKDKIQIKVPFKLHPGQQLVWDHPALTKLVNCHIGWGKTHMAANYSWFKTVELALARLQQPAIYRHRVPLAVGWYITPTFELVEFATQLLKKWIPEPLQPHWDGLKKDFYILPYTKTDHTKDYRVKLSMRSGLKPELLLVDTVDLAVYDESRELSAEVRKNTLSRVNRPGSAGMELVMGSGGPMFDPNDVELPHWFYALYLRIMTGDFDDMMAWKIGVESELKKPDMTQEIIDKAKRELIDDPLIYERDYNAEFIGRGHEYPVIPEYKSKLQYFDIRERYSNKATMYHGWDFGWKAPAVDFSQIADNNQWRSLGQKIGSEVPLPVFAREALQFFRTHWGDAETIEVWAPESGRQHKSTDGKTEIDVLTEIYREFGYNIAINVVREDETSIERAIDILRMRCRERTIGGEPLLLVDKSCTVLNEALAGGYRRSPDKFFKSGQPKPHKDGYFDNAVDALKILAMSRVMDVLGYSKAQQEVSVDDGGIDPDEWRGRA